MATVTLTTHAFEALARVQARAMGYPELRLVVIRHPLGGIPQEQAVLKASGALERLVELLGEEG